VACDSIVCNGDPFHRIQFFLVFIFLTLSMAAISVCRRAVNSAPQNPPHVSLESSGSPISVNHNLLASSIQFWALPAAEILYRLGKPWAMDARHRPAVAFLPPPSQILSPLMDMRGFPASSKDTHPYEHLTFIQEDPTLPNQRKKPRTLTACDRW